LWRSHEKRRRCGSIFHTKCDFVELLHLERVEIATIDVRNTDGYIFRLRKCIVDGRGKLRNALILSSEAVKVCIVDGNADSVEE
jgi:hypothetical protein